ncbi:hypothetical protein AAH994_15635, partial [Weeksellaceae bacterium A-14]
YMPDIGRWGVVDPLAEKMPNFSPYAFSNNNPIIFVDPDGRSASPIYDTEGNFLGTDNQGLQGKAIVMNKSDFSQGMKHEDAMNKDLAPNGGTEYYDAIPGYTDYVKFYNHYNNLPNRPDYDGFISIRDGIDWAKSHPNALKNPTPDNSLYADTSKLDFGNITVDNFPQINTVTPQNLFNVKNASESSYNERLHATVYALGRVNMILHNRANGSVSIVNDNATDYDWNKGGGIIRSSFINKERMVEGLNDSHGFKVFYYGIGKLRK